YIQGLGGSEIEIGVVMGLYSVAGIVCQPLVGAWVDAFGRRPFMRFGTAAVVVTELVALVSDSVGVFGVLRLLQGVGYSAFFVSNYTMAIDLVPVERRGWALGIYGVAGLTSTALAPLAGEWMVSRYGFRGLFVLAALLTSVAVALVWRIPERRAHIDAAPGRLPALQGSLDLVVQRPMLIALVFGLGSGGAHGFLYPGLAALVTDATTARRRGAVVGLFSAAVLSGNALGAFVFGYLAARLGYGLMWTVLSLILLMGFALSVKLEEARQYLRNEVASS